MDIKKLVTNLIEYDYHYTLGNPLISDKEYDNLRDRLYELDPKNKYLKRIGCEDTSNCQKLKYWLGSQTKIKDEKKNNNFFYTTFYFFFEISYLSWRSYYLIIINNNNTSRRLVYVRGVLVISIF